MNDLKMRAKKLAENTADAYSCGRYDNWAAVAAMLLRRGLTEEQAEVVLRSKWTRWAADASNQTFPNSKDLARWMDDPRNKANVAELCKEAGL